MTTYEISTISISVIALGISIWAIINNKRNSTESDAILFSRIEEIIEPIYLYEKNNGFEFDKKYLTLCKLFDFTREFDNYHFSKQKVEKSWSNLKNQIIDFKKKSADALLSNSESNIYNSEIESYVYIWEKEYFGNEMPKNIGKTIESLKKQYPSILEQLQELLKTYSKLCIEYKKN